MEEYQKNPYVNLKQQFWSGDREIVRESVRVPQKIKKKVWWKGSDECGEGFEKKKKPNCLVSFL